MLKSVFLAFGIVSGLSTSTIFTPLWLDSMSDSSKMTVNNSGNSSSNAIDNYAVIFFVSIINLLLSSVIMITILLIRKFLKIWHTKVNCSKGNMFYVGLADAVSTIFLVYAANGSRTAPYLQAIATNFAIPVTFLTRFVILHKKPSLRKTISAIMVFCAELVALIPDIFPKLENDSSKSDDGGASGIAGILWPLCYFAGFIPQAIVNVVFEKSAKDLTSNNHPTMETIHMMFWSYLFCFLSLLALFWTDLIPGFGDASTIKMFWEKLSFDFECFLGAADCPSLTILYSGITILAMLLTRLFVVVFLHFSEGANFLIIIMSLQTPVVVLFWTLFNEHPFHWNPNVHLSTWLSITAICIMLPSIYCYNRSSTETTDKNERADHQSEEARRLLVCSTDSYQSIDALSTVVINSDTMTSHHNPLGIHRPYSPQFASSLNTEGSDVEWSFS
ncbi:uncharacterized protein LOC125650310 [Ostrea edulis]|uniref:uncharacterized protein LOC125650310 n=1 Tax=Ostrea edulis TaxID=37623 RepID=UPI0024AF58AB|nr:uncharacterized protein LOC125650310 [Ostrea edulis]